MNRHPSQGQSQQQAGHLTPTAPDRPRADTSPGLPPPAPEPGSDGAAPGSGDSPSTPRPEQQPLGQPARQQQGDALGPDHPQPGAPVDGAADAGDTRPSGDGCQSPSLR